MRPPAWLVVVLVGALAGLVFAGISTYDFVQHLDRQVHSLHCSFIPGAGAETGSTGCQVAMMSPYSSVLRTSIWGGVPISLPAMAVFAFLVFYGLELLVSRRTNAPRATAFLALATGLPALTSLVMLTISLVKLGTTCKLCVGIYLASAMCLTGAIVLWRRALRLRDAAAPAAPNKYLGAMFGAGVGFVLLPFLVYVAMAPDHGKFIGSCGELAQPADTYGVMVPLHRGGKVPALEVLDPLCPACRAFEQRLASSGLEDQLDRKAILFPLDTTCNWMITEDTHPGACTISEAVLCAGDRAREVIAWSFEVQERIRTETKADPTAAARIVKERFPELAACVGSPEAKSKLNKSLRWAVANNIRVLTPQLFVNNVKLCDEDVDLGLDYALSRMIDGDMPARLHSAKPVEAPLPEGSAATGSAASPAHTSKPAKSAAGTPADGPATTSTNAPVTTPTSPTTTTTTPPTPPASEAPVTSPSASEPPAADKPTPPAPADPLPPEAPPAEGSNTGGAP
ncbi:MAG: vitamin K epoxide reductase family protein [Kofleriaceae bacterium]|nr:vitamin K epoxide reductase family protein [Kofleriaceae bacterium]